MQVPNHWNAFAFRYLEHVITSFGRHWTMLLGEMVEKSYECFLIPNVALFLGRFDEGPLGQLFVELHSAALRNGASTHCDVGSSNRSVDERKGRYRPGYPPSIDAGWCGLASLDVRSGNLCLSNRQSRIGLCERQVKASLHMVADLLHEQWLAMWVRQHAPFVACLHVGLAGWPEYSRPDLIEVHHQPGMNLTAGTKLLYVKPHRFQLRRVERQMSSGLFISLCHNPEFATKAACLLPGQLPADNPQE